VQLIGHADPIKQQAAAEGAAQAGAAPAGAAAAAAQQPGNATLPQLVLLRVQIELPPLPRPLACKGYKASTGKKLNQDPPRMIEKKKGD
jgi:hypothetical protein